MFILIAYDVADERRLKQIAKLMEAYGERVQRSVFECVIDEHQLRIIIHKTKHLMKRKEDKVQLYHFCDACEHRIGSASQVSFAVKDIYVC
jgi:CRISPR-associated protein Cas2